MPVHPWCCLVAQSCQLFAIPWAAARQASLSFSISWNFLKLMSTELVMSSNHLILCRPLLLPLIFPSTRVFSAALWSLQNPQLPKPSRFWRRRHPTPAQALESKASLKTKGISSLHLVSGKKKSHSFTKNEKASPTLPFLSLQWWYFHKRNCLIGLFPLNYFLTIQAVARAGCLSLAHLSFQLLSFLSWTMAASRPLLAGTAATQRLYGRVPRLGSGFVPLTRQPLFHLPVSPFCAI